MTVQYSIQKMVSDGTLSTIALGIQYLQRNDIYIRIAGEETPQSGAPSGYTWSFLDNTTLRILPVVPNGTEVVIYRRTDINAMYNIYSQNAQFDESTIDENNQQLLYIAQEYLEQGIPGAGVAALEYLNTVAGVNYYRFSLTDGSYTPPFGVPDGTALLRSELASNLGSSLVGTPNGTLDGVLGAVNERLTSLSYNQIRNYTGNLSELSCYGITSIFDGASGTFKVDTTDTVSPDNNCTVLVDATGRRWKRVYTGPVNIRWGGATNTTPDCQSVINNIISNVSNNIIVDDGDWHFNGSIIVPNAVNLRINGGNWRNTKFVANAAAGFPLIKYERSALVSGTTLTIDNISCVWGGAAKLANSAAIKFHGYGDGQDDNWLRVTQCQFYFFEIGIDTKHCGHCYFRNNWYQGNRYSHYMRRGSSFFHLHGEFSFDGTFIFAQDTTYDAYSNGLTISECSHVTGLNESVFIDGWQAVFILNCGFDLGSGGNAAVWLKYCQDVQISGCFISSNKAITQTRDAIRLDMTHTYSISDSTIVNSIVGIRINGNPAIVGGKVYGVISACKFEGNIGVDILLDSVVGAKISHNHFQTPMSHTGANYEIYATGTTNKCIVTENTFVGATYALSVGAASITTNNIFGI